MGFSSYMSELLRNELYELNNPQLNKDISPLNYLAKIQLQISTIPKENEFLIESFETKEGFHTIFYPFEGRFVHEALSHLIAYRISLLKPVTFSLAYNDYGFELLSDEFLNIENIRGSNGIFFQKNIKQLSDIKKFITKKCQTITYYGIDKGEFRDVLTKNNLLGVDRIVPIGKALEIDLIWDGYDVIRSLSRVITHK